MLTLAVITVVLSIVSYWIYLYGTFRGSIRPHGLTWMIWAAMNGLIFYQQISQGAGFGAWVTLVACLASVVISITGFIYGGRRTNKLDYICLMLAIVAMSAWVLAADPNLLVLLASMVFVIGFVPTFQKARKDPMSENAITFTLNGSKFLIALFALQAFNFTTAFYPIVLVVINLVFAGYIFKRQFSLKRFANKQTEEVYADPNSI